MMDCMVSSPVHKIESHLLRPVSADGLKTDLEKTPAIEKR